MERISRQCEYNPRTWNHQHPAALTCRYTGPSVISPAMSFCTLPASSFPVMVINAKWQQTNTDAEAPLRAWYKWAYAHHVGTDQKFETRDLRWACIPARCVHLRLECLGRILKYYFTRSRPLHLGH